ncbi:MAG: hypothetical protein KC501_07780 [Myxococcales bacterium]|nr:hypothetical protein [Myxococcales bacterium]
MAHGSTILVSLSLILAACTGTPTEVMTTTLADDDGSTGSSGGGPATGPTSPGDETAVGTMGMTGSMTTTATGMDTTGGMSATDSGDTGDGSSSDGPAMCPAPCGNNEVCDNGTCVAACNPWGAGGYDYCLDDYGAFTTMDSCGAGSACLFYAPPLVAAACTRPCTTRCECPGPPASGDATVTCGDVTNDGQSECYLSCTNEESCPAGMDCIADGAVSFCMFPSPPLPAYGNCGLIDGPCPAGTYCLTENGHSLCFDESCENGCAAAPPGYGAICDSVISPPSGSECILPCTGDGNCPPGMSCYTSNVGGQLCMWPPP